MKIVTPPQAAEQVKQAGVVFVDVRSQQEFAAGHPEGSVNIPLLDHDASGQMVPNPEFIPVFQATFADKSAPVILTCRSGGRSGRAGGMLEHLGYTDVTNMDGGWSGNGAVAGWSTEGLPASTENGDGVSYASIKAKAGQ
ncbi:MAG: rhodanese-like domain-containing protein [Bradymonadia bacterium]